ncbi:MAG: MarR family transcriptional regulator [Myxococcales bacterium]|nr:MarR family transcriptional regulator [Myxococcales bacterium]
MQNISPKDDLIRDVRRFKELMIGFGRRRSLRDPVAAAVEELELSPPQIHTLLWVGHEGQLTMGEVAQRLGVSEKTVTGIIDRLERRHLVSRERGDADRRVVRCKLTKTGEKVYHHLDELTSRAMGQFLGLLDREDRQLLFRLLEKVQRKIESATAAARKAAQQ